MWKAVGIVAVITGGCVAEAAGSVEVSGELRAWHKVTLTFEGPESNENAAPNPFLDYRLNVYLTNGAKLYVVPGYYAADGNAGETSATKGNKWRAHFRPDAAGKWTYVVSFRSGPNIAVSPEPGEGSPGAMDGLTGTIAVGASDKAAPDLRAKGALQYAGQRYLRFAGTGEHYLAGGAMSPENFLAYYEFDGTFDIPRLIQGNAGGEKFIHRYEPHAQDWRPGDPVWKSGKGKNIIGAVNYLASKGMNSVLFMPYTIDGGDGNDTWPWTAPDERLRFDCSKLDQWEIVFSHMEKLGLVLHFLTSETENDQGLDGGDLGIQRRLYYRELIARFGHHLGVIWNLGEENTNTPAQQRAFSTYLKNTDPYRHAVVTHTYPREHDKVYNALLAYPDFDGASLQNNETGSDTHSETIKWIERSEMAGHPWVVQLDEYGHGQNGVKTDALDPAKDEPRKNCLWGNLMAGGGGANWYFGYKYPHSDLISEDWRQRDIMWNQTRYALEFFRTHVPFAEMTACDSLVSSGYCFAKRGSVYVVYLPEGGTATLLVETGKYTVEWFNPRLGGALQQGNVREVAGPATVSLGSPPRDARSDWVILCRKR